MPFAPRGRHGRRLIGFMLVVCLVSGAASTEAATLHLPPGKILFGTGLRAKPTIHLTHVRSSFGANDTIAWVAYLADNVNAKSVTIVILRRSPDGSLSSLYSQKIPVKNPKYNVLGNSMSPSTRTRVGIASAGTYVMRYLRGKTKLAEGRFAFSG